MLESLLSYFKSEALHKATLVLGTSSQIVRMLEKEFYENPEDKNAAIDLLISILQAQKK